ncbi:odorant receptor 49b-like [Teleopsis dalmanni]|uniref:odorant receptor 49b-like n=1 Tax=Teleopsis dalmanni TaxID=139649 RepID=UPI0018CFC865|nr:odorant receptor 49b-like [Teleopsis dalmanni]
MFEDIPLIYMSIKTLKFWSLIYDRSWRRLVCLSMTTFMVLTQFSYIFQTDEGIQAIIRNAYCTVLWFNTIFRAYMLLLHGERYQNLIALMVKYYNELRQSKDMYIKHLLDEADGNGKIMVRGNLFLGLLTSIGFGCYPLFANERVLPFGSMIPGINELKTPFYQFWYVYQMTMTPIGCCMYIPYTSLVVGLIMFGIVMCKSLQYRLKTLKNIEYNSHQSIQNSVIECIKYQNRIIRYIEVINQLTTYVFLIEFLAFGTLLCALLFLLIIIDSTAQTVIVCAYISMTFAQILALYWYANELREQNLAVAAAAYETDWFLFDTSTQKYILLIIMRAQRPSTIKVGDNYPMTLELFQSLLNASYTYFTLLKRVYG